MKFEFEFEFKRKEEIESLLKQYLINEYVSLNKCVFLKWIRIYILNYCDIKNGFCIFILLIIFVTLLSGMLEL